MSKPPPDDSEQEPLPQHLTHKDDESGPSIFTAFVFAFVFFVVALGCFGGQFFPDIGKVASVIATTTALGGAGITSGALTGFIFGVPRMLQADAPVETPQSSNARTTNAPSEPDAPGETSQDSNARTTKASSKSDKVVLSNSNLEQISDWLTKILVGVGLVEIKSIAAGLASLSGALYEPLGGVEASGVFGVATLLYAFVVGFVLMYMWTRTRFLQVLRQFEGPGGSHARWGRRRPFRR